MRINRSCRARCRFEGQASPPNRAAVSASTTLSSGWIPRSANRAVLVSNSISIDAAALVAAASTRNSATRSAIIAAPSSVHDRAGIVLDDLGRKLPQCPCGVRMNPLPDHHPLGAGFMRSLKRAFGRRRWLQRACGSILTEKRMRLMRARRQLDSDRSRSPSGRFHLFPDQNGATFATVLRAFERGCRNRENVPVEFEEPDLVGSGPSLIP